MLSSYNRARLLLLTATIICFCAFWWVGRAMHVPANRGFEDSLLQQPAALTVVLVVAIVLVGCTALGTAVAGMIRFNAGLVVACLGLSALSMRSGASRYTVWWGMSHGATAEHVYGRLFFEMAILTVFIAACWWALRALYSFGFIRDRESQLPDHLQTLAADKDGAAAKAEPRSDLNDALTEAGAAAMQMAITLLLVLLLAASEAKAQVMAAVFFASFLGPVLGAFLSMSGRYGGRFAWSWLAKIESGRRGWYWLPPLLVGMIGFALAANRPTGAENGHLIGPLAALARPLPLDYASLGTAGAILGHWMARRWAREDDAATD